MPAPGEELERIETELLLEAVERRWGYDFRGYARPSLVRRLRRRMAGEGLESLSQLQHLVLRDAAVMDRLLVDLAINVTTMFRAPPFFAALTERVLPLLATYPFLRIWNAGCSTGEETWSLAIALHERGLLERTRIYATDINDQLLGRARAGAFRLDRMREYTRNYIAAGGERDFSSYYRVDGSWARFDPALARRAVFARHNLVSDGPFNEFDLILCRHVLIYFGRQLQDRAHGLFYDSLHALGVLGLGEKESLGGSPFRQRYEPLGGDQRLYRKTA